mgnify:CR=1 FL=1
MPLSYEEYSFIVEVWEIVVLFFQFSYHYSIQNDFKLERFKDNSLENIKLEVIRVSKKVNQIYGFVFWEKYFQEKIILPYRHTLGKEYLIQNPQNIVKILKNIWKTWFNHNFDFIFRDKKVTSIYSKENDIEIFSLWTFVWGGPFIVFEKSTGYISDSFFDKDKMFQYLEDKWFCPNYLYQEGYKSLHGCLEQHNNGKVVYRKRILEISHIEDYINLGIEDYMSFSAMKDGKREYFIWKIDFNCFSYIEVSEISQKCNEVFSWERQYSCAAETDTAWKITKINVDGKMASRQEYYLEYDGKWQIIKWFKIIIKRFKPIKK